MAATGPNGDQVSESPDSAATTNRDSKTAPPDEQRARSGARPVKIALVAITVLGLVLAVGSFLVPDSAGSVDGASPKVRQEVISRVNDFAVTYNTYSVAEVEDYQKRVKPFLTPQYDAEFVKVTDGFFKALESRKQKSGDARVLRTAVSSIDNDSAEVLVAVNATLTNTDNDQPIPRNFRWKVSLRKTKGEWKVASYSSVATDTTGGQQPGEQPSAGTETPGEGR